MKLNTNELSVLGYLLRHLLTFGSEIDKKQIEYLGILNYKYGLTPELLHSDNLNNLDKVRSFIKEMTTETREELLGIIAEMIIVREKPDDNQLDLSMKFITLLKGNQVAVITDKGETLSGMEGNKMFAWKNEEIMNKAGINTWKKTNFYPENGMIGEIVDSFPNPIFGFTIFVLLVNDVFYVPMNEKGIKIL